MPTHLSPCNPEIFTLFNMDPSVCKRRDYTPGLAEAALPSEMSGPWEELVLKLRDLYSKLGNHEAMRPNLDQTFSTPANSKNSVYFMWDFIGRTLHLLYLTPATLGGNLEQQKRWESVQGRAVYGAMLILDQMPGALEQLLAAGPGGGGEQPKMGKEVQDSARALLRK